MQVPLEISEKQQTGRHIRSVLLSNYGVFIDFLLKGCSHDSG